MMSTTTLIPLIFGLKGAQLIFILAIGLLIFGAARLPKIMRNIGRSVHSFKQGVEEAKAEMNKPVKSADEIVREREAAEHKVTPTATAKDTDGPND